MSTERNLLKPFLFLITCISLQYVISGVGGNSVFLARLYTSRQAGSISEEAMSGVLAAFNELSYLSLYASILVLLLSVIFVFGENKYSRFEKFAIIGPNILFVAFKLFAQRAS